ncbi:MAG: hypothetical protein ABJN51_16045, partial [Sneathiella sp.]
TVADSIKGLKVRYGTRFWISEIKESSSLSREILSTGFGFQSVCDFTVSDVNKEFDGLDIVARTLRRAIGENSSVVIYADTGELFPKEEYERGF